MALRKIHIVVLYPLCNYTTFNFWPYVAVLFEEMKGSPAALPRERAYAGRTG
jgi:hypothetical protein